MVECSGKVSHNKSGSLSAPAVLWYLECYRHALKERRADESAPPTQKEISMKKLLAIIKDAALMERTTPMKREIEALCSALLSLHIP